MRHLGRSAGTVSMLRIAIALSAIVAVAGCASPAASVVAPTPSSAASTASPTATAAAASATPSAPAANASAALRDLAGSRYFGSALAMPQLARDTKYTQIAGTQFSAVTPENAMKWGLVEPSKGQFEWADADAIVAFAEAHNQKMRGHTLVWHTQLPDWISGGSFSKAELSAILQQHITTEVSRYAGKIYAWDVVNEVIADDGSMRDDVFLKVMGQEYIADAFRWAHAADPSAKLYINDYDVEGVNPKSDALYKLVKSLKDQGVPIDGVGFQGHFDLQNPFPTDFVANMQRFAALGLDVAITELDVRVETPATATELTKQADYYRQTVADCLAVPTCVGITVWGFTDKYSWVPSVFPGKGAAALYDSNMDPKPALAAVEQALAGH